MFNGKKILVLELLNVLYPTRMPVSRLSFCTDCPSNYNLDQMIDVPFAFPSFRPCIANDIQYF